MEKMDSAQAENNTKKVCTYNAMGDIIEGSRVRVVFDDGSALTVDDPVYTQIKDGILEIHENDCSYFVSMAKVRFVEAIRNHRAEPMTA